MLKITAIDEDGQRKLVLEGRLVEPWVAEVEKSWQEAQGASGPRPVSIDLKDVTAISQAGEDLLLRMMSEGAAFHCCRGVLTRHVLERLGDRLAARSAR